MCGRFYLDVSFEELLTRYDLRRLEMDYEPRREIYPSDRVQVITQSSPNAITELTWGISLPHFKSPIINGRSEELFDKPLFKNLVLVQRCLIPATGYFEWQGNGRLKVKHQISSEEGGVFSMAGLYGSFNQGGETKQMAVVLTQNAGDYLSWLHSRMPVILNREEEKKYLGQMEKEEVLTFFKAVKGVSLMVKNLSHQLTFQL